MIGKKEMTLIANGKKLVNKYKKNFSNFIDDDFELQIMLQNDLGYIKHIKCTVNAENLMDYLTQADFGENYKVYRIVIHAPKA